MRRATWVGYETSLATACVGVDVVYYLVHSMTEPGFAALDRRGALLTAQAARQAGVRRIVYLGGLHQDADGRALSEHLGSAPRSATSSCAAGCRLRCYGPPW